MFSIDKPLKPRSKEQEKILRDSTKRKKFWSNPEPDMSVFYQRRVVKYGHTPKAYLRSSILAHGYEPYHVTSFSAGYRVDDPCSGYMFFDDDGACHLIAVAPNRYAAKCQWDIFTDQFDNSEVFTFVVITHNDVDELFKEYF